MGNGERPRHRGPGRGAGAPRSEPRVLVLPGEEVPDRGLRPGFGTYRVGKRVYASILGYATWRAPFVLIVPFSGRYIPKPNDAVVGVVQDVQKTFWLLDIDAPRWAPLHVSGTPWKPEPGDLEQHLRIGDAVLVAVENLEATGRIGVTMNGEGLGKLTGGTIARVSPAKIPRVIGKGGSMIHAITRRTGAQVAIGQNGRIWIDGDEEGIRRVRECLRIIEEEGQKPGLTDRIEGYLETTGPADETGPHSSAGGEIPARSERPSRPNPPGDEGPPADDANEELPETSPTGERRWET